MYREKKEYWDNKNLFSHNKFKNNKLHDMLFTHLTISSYLFLKFKPDFLQSGIYGKEEKRFSVANIGTEKNCSTLTFKF